MTQHRSEATRGLPPKLMWLGRRRSSFQICGIIGLFLGTSLAMGLAGASGLSRAVVAGLLFTGIISFLALAMGTKIVSGREALVYYHHEVAILAASAFLLAALTQPVLPYLDVTALGLGVFLACGRCGCVLVGCCHGRPWRWGVRYGREHADEGFASRYVGARLFPVQPLEGLLVAAIVFIGAITVVQGAPAGTALSWYVVSYSLARIGLEELRGDPARPYWLQLSEAQWTSLLLIVGIALSGWLGRVPWARWHTPVAAVAALSMLALAVRRSGPAAIVQPRHAGEIADIVMARRDERGVVAVRQTSLTVGLSTQALGLPGRSDGMLYSMSRASRPLTPGEAHILARLILNLAARPHTEVQLLQGQHNVFHLILHGNPRPVPPPAVLGRA